VTLNYALVHTEFADFVYQTAGKVVRHLDLGGLVPATDLQNVWATAFLALWVTWFQPVVLRLSFWRCVTWICLPLILVLPLPFFEPEGWVLGAYTFAAMAVPGVALVSSRRPWWVIFPAAACDVAIFWLGHFESEGCWAAGKIAYGAILLWGTHRIDRGKTPDHLSDG